MTPESAQSARPMISGLHDAPVSVEKNDFKFKSLSNWACNLFMGCVHGCRFCYVTETSTGKQGKLLGAYGVKDPVADWGRYVLVRPWDRGKFMRSLRTAERTPEAQLKPDGNRAVFFCSTTDPYQTIRHSDPKRRKLLDDLARQALREALETIRDHSTLNVRILTRSPLARNDFTLFRSFGDRLLLGTSLPTLDPQLAKLFEPKVPAPRQRLQMLIDAHAAGIPTFVAVAPVFPECGFEGMREVFGKVREADPWTIFLEPVNLRLGIAQRIAKEANRLGRGIDMTPYTDPGAWADYALQTLRDAERAARETGVSDRLHLWPDHRALGAKAVVARQPDPDAYLEWLQSWWDRISEWPGRKGRRGRGRRPQKRHM